MRIAESRESLISRTHIASVRACRNKQVSIVFMLHCLSVKHLRVQYDLATAGKISKSKGVLNSLSANFVSVQASAGNVD